MLGIPCSERPTIMVSQQRGVTDGSHAPRPSIVVLILNGEQGNGGASSVLQLSLTELRVGLLDNPL
jgi:hypothetical protein